MSLLVNLVSYIHCNEHTYSGFSNQFWKFISQKYYQLKIKQIFERNNKQTFSSAGWLQRHIWRQISDFARWLMWVASKWNQTTDAFRGKKQAILFSSLTHWASANFRIWCEWISYNEGKDNYQFWTQNVYRAFKNVTNVAYIELLTGTI